MLIKIKKYDIIIITLGSVFMKIITSNAVYVQKNDIGFLNQTDLPIPASIFMKVFGKGVTIIDNSNRFEFVKFEEESEIEFFRNLDWIIDYDLVKGLGEEQIIELGQGIAQEKNTIAQTFNAMSDDKRRANEHLVYECERLDFKMYSLRDVLRFKQGHIQFALPDGIDCSEGCKEVEEKGLRRILSKFKKRRQVKKY